MAEITEPVMLDSTGKAIESQLGKLNQLKAMELGKTTDALEDWAHYGAMCEDGSAKYAFPVNTKFTLGWADPTTGASKSYDNRFRVLDYQERDVKGADARPCAVLQQVLTLPLGLCFDAEEAFYAVPSGGLKAGTYYVTAGESWGKLVENQTYQFTTTKALSEGAQLCFASSCYDTVPESVTTYATCGATTANETCAVTVGGKAGTALGTLSSSTKTASGEVNNLHCVGLGKNRWAQSALRQWLNSDAAAGKWWTAQNKWDRPPAYAATTAGYLSGFSDKGFVAAMQYAKVKTALPYCDGGTSGGTECDTTYDRVWLPSAEDLYLACTSYGVPYGLEGKACQYYKELAGGSSPTSAWATHAEYIICAMGAETSAQGVFERSAGRSSGCNVACVHASGSVSYYGARNGFRCAPACLVSIPQS